MKCMVCQAVLTASDYCPKCGSYIKAQKKAGALSNLYYNQGLEKAQIRDLSRGHYLSETKFENE